MSWKLSGFQVKGVQTSRKLLKWVTCKTTLKSVCHQNLMSVWPYCLVMAIHTRCTVVDWPLWNSAQVMLFLDIGSWEQGPWGCTLLQTQTGDWLMCILYHGMGVYSLPSCNWLAHNIIVQYPQAYLANQLVVNLRKICNRFTQSNPLYSTT